MNKYTFLTKAKEIYGDRYDYSKVPDNINWTTKYEIICPKHGSFYKTTANHINNKQGCPICYIQNRTSNTDEFIKKAKQIHGDKYDYSKVDYVNNYTKVCIICPEHGEFWQKPNSHLTNQGCPKCADNVKLTNEEFIERARAIHGNKYDYSKVKYIGNKKKVTIICPEHGEFLQTPNAHLHGYECNMCRGSAGERKIRLFCENNNFKLNDDYFLDYYGYKWLGNQHLDCCFPKYNLAFEFDGQQHFDPYSKFGGEKYLKHQQELDARKDALCKENGIELIRIPYWEINNIEKIMNDKLSTFLR